MLGTLPLEPLPLWQKHLEGKPPQVKPASLLLQPLKPSPALRHGKADAEAQEAFKKTPRRSPGGEGRGAEGEACGLRRAPPLGDWGIRTL